MQFNFRVPKFNEKCGEFCPEFRLSHYEFSASWDSLLFSLDCPFNFDFISMCFAILYLSSVATSFHLSLVLPLAGSRWLFVERKSTWKMVRSWIVASLEVSLLKLGRLSNNLVSMLNNVLRNFMRSLNQTGGKNASLLLRDHFENLHPSQVDNSYNSLLLGWRATSW